MGLDGLLHLGCSSMMSKSSSLHHQVDVIKSKPKETVAILKNPGARVALFSCDRSKIADLDHVLEHCKWVMPPIRGMIHAALVLKARKVQSPQGLIDHLDVDGLTSQLEGHDQYL